MDNVTAFIDFYDNHVFPGLTGKNVTQYSACCGVLFKKRAKKLDYGHSKDQTVNIRSLFKKVNTEEEKAAQVSHFVESHNELRGSLPHINVSCKLQGNQQHKEFDEKTSPEETFVQTEEALLKADINSNRGFELSKKISELEERVRSLEESVKGLEINLFFAFEFNFANLKFIYFLLINLMPSLYNLA